MTFSFWFRNTSLSVILFDKQFCLPRHGRGSGGNLSEWKRSWNYLPKWTSQEFGRFDWLPGWSVWSGWSLFKNSQEVTASRPVWLSFVQTFTALSLSGIYPTTHQVTPCMSFLQQYASSETCCGEAFPWQSVRWNSSESLCYMPTSPSVSLVFIKFTPPALAIPNEFSLFNGHEDD